MKTVELQADLHALCEAVAQHLPVDPEVAARVRERANEVRAELRARGTTNVALDLVRQARDE